MANQALIQGKNVIKSLTNKMLFNPKLIQDLKINK